MEQLLYYPAICIGRLISCISRIFRIGAGATWPGEVALRISPNILRRLSSQLRRGIIVVAGTNGKTTTTLMIKKILESHGDTVIHNESGANLLNGIVSALVTNIGKKDWGVFEVDENSLPIVLRFIRPRTIIFMNLFRDQLDRYGEVDAIAEKWKRMLGEIGPTTRIVANADDPMIAFVTEEVKERTTYIGLEEASLYLPVMQHATDTIYCPKCGNRLTFGGVYFSHLGKWACGRCGFVHPDVLIRAKDYQSPVEGVYNIYNTLAAAATAESIGIPQDAIIRGLATFTPAFGRMESLQYEGKMVRILLSKNPTGFNESIRTVLSSDKKGPMLLLLNDRIPDGTDISWIWDVDFELLHDLPHPIFISGDRAYDMGVRMEYALRDDGHIDKKQQQGTDDDEKKMAVEQDLQDAVQRAVRVTGDAETLWILATYSAMLDVRKILTGKKIL